MPPPRLSTPTLWVLLVVFAGAITVLVHQLFETARTSLRNEQDRALERERTAYLVAAQDYTSGIFRSSIAELASFHEEGLAHALTQWDNANDVVLRTHVLTGDAETPPLIDAADYLHTRFSVSNAPGLGDDLGYQAENLENVRYAGRVAAPFAGWAASLVDPLAPWIIWYRTGPAEPIRVAEIDTTSILQQLARLHRDDTIATLRLEPAPFAEDPPLELLPAHALIVEPGALFRQRAQSTRLLGAAAFLALGALLVSAAILIHRSQRDARDALRKTTFVSLVSHELRTPVTSIRMFADMLEDPTLPPEKRARFTATIQRESARLGHLIERLLAFNALEKRSAPPPRQPVELTTLLRETVETATPPLAAAGLTPTLTLPVEPLTVSTDAQTVRQALLNLCDNAAKYAPRTGDLRIELSTTDGSAQLTVTDRGPGIGTAQRPRLFEPFVQGHDRLTDKQPGLGLGLALSRAALRSVGGDLVLLPAAPGATFAIRLPLA